MDADGVLYSKSQDLLIAFPESHPSPLFIAPDTLRTIGTSSFQSVRNLTSVTLNDQLNSIHSLAFADPGSIPNLTIPPNVSEIATTAFLGNTNLLSLNVAPENINFASRNGVLFSKDLSTLIAYPAGRTATSYQIPTGTERLRDYAFFEAENLTSVTFPDTLTDSGTYTFSHAPKLETVRLGSTITKLGNGLFWTCRSLGRITIPPSVTHVGSSTFSDCSALENIEIPDTVLIMGQQAFRDCTRLKTVSIRLGIQTMQTHSFANCSSLQAIEFDGPLTRFSSRALIDIPEDAVLEMPPFSTSGATQFGPVKIKKLPMIRRKDDKIRVDIDFPFVEFATLFQFTDLKTWEPVEGVTRRYKTFVVPEDSLLAPNTKTYFQTRLRLTIPDRP